MIETDSFSDRLIAADTASPQEDALERALRPKRLADYVGQQKIREQLEIFIEAARRRRKPSTTSCCSRAPGPWQDDARTVIVAHEMGVKLRSTSGPVIERAGDLAAILTNLEPQRCAFHRRDSPIKPVVEEILYPPWRISDSTS